MTILEESKMLLVKNGFGLFKKQSEDYQLLVYDNDQEMQLLNFIIDNEHLYTKNYVYLLAKAYKLRSKLYIEDKIEILNLTQIHLNLKHLMDAFDAQLEIITVLRMLGFYSFYCEEKNIIFEAELKKFLTPYYYIKEETSYTILGLKA